MFEVEVQLELGHKATPKPKISSDGYTHDWTVFVRGSENSEIEHFIEKIVFNLHESFPKHKRVIREPPYEVCESGYAGFELPIDVYFKNREEPKKVSFEYDLYLRVDEAVSNTRREKLTFKNPSNDFKKKLLKANGVLHDKSGSTSSYSSSNYDKSQTYVPKGSKSSHSYNDSRKSNKSSVIPSKDKSHHSQHSSSSLSTSASATVEKSSTAPALQNQFADLFGTPIQPKPSPESTVYKSKEFSSKTPQSSNVSVTSKKSQKERSSDYRRSSYDTEKKHKSSKSVKTEKTNSESSSGRNDNNKSKQSKSSSSKSSDSKTSKQPSGSNDSFRDKKSSSSNESSNKSGSKKRRRSSSSVSSFTGSSLTEEKKEKEHSSKSTKEQSDHKKESKKHRSSKDVISTNNASGNSSSHKSKDVKKESSTSTTISFSNNNNTGTTTLEIKSVKKEKTWDSEVKKSKNKEQKNDEIKSKESSKSKSKEELRSPKPTNSKLIKVPKDKLHTSVSQREVSSSPASIMSGSLTPGGGAYLGAPLSVSSNNGPNVSAVADIEQESLSPLSSGEPVSPFVHSSHKDMNFSDDDSSGNDRQFTSSSRGFSSKNKECFVSETVDRKSNKQNDTTTVFDTSYINELMSLQRKLNELTDRDVVQKVVDTIEESGLFSLTNTSVDFDLMKLDKTTVKKLKMCLTS